MLLPSERPGITKQNCTLKSQVLGWVLQERGNGRTLSISQLRPGPVSPARGSTHQLFPTSDPEVHCPMLALAQPFLGFTAAFSALNFACHLCLFPARKIIQGANLVTVDLLNPVGAQKCWQIDFYLCKQAMGECRVVHHRELGSDLFFSVFGMLSTKTSLEPQTLGASWVSNKLL